MKSTMHSPKLLSWLAEKAGIPMSRAEMLWEAAQRHAAGSVGTADESAYWSAAMDRLHELVAAESLREDVASFGWRRWTRTQERFWQAPLAVFDALMLNSVRNWRVFKPLQIG